MTGEAERRAQLAVASLEPETKGEHQQRDTRSGKVGRGRGVEDPLPAAPLTLRSLPCKPAGGGGGRVYSQLCTGAGKLGILNES